MESESRKFDHVDRYRLYLDESGDHVFSRANDPAHRYLCLLGCWFRNADYLQFHHRLEALKVQLLRHHPDEPAVLHREDMLHARKSFACLRDRECRAAWDEGLLALIADTETRVVAVVIDKFALVSSYGSAAAHPYHLGLGFMLQRFAGFLNHVNRSGDVMAESRGSTEDRLLKDSYTRVYERGAWMVPAQSFQHALTSRQLKLKPKSANIAGLQLADLLGHPVKQWVLRERSLIRTSPTPFAEQLVNIVIPKLNRHLYRDQVDGYGIVFYPKG